MKGLLAIMGRELRSYFFSPLGWVVLTGFLFFQGIGFITILSYLNDPRAPAGTTPLDFFFGETLFFWLALMFVAPVITMRLLSEEQKSGTIEVLLTAPVSSTQVVLGKYLGALVFYAFLWLPTVIYVAIVAKQVDIDWGPIASSYLGIFGIGALFLAAGLFASATSRNQIVAAVIAFALLFVLFIPAFLDMLVNHEMLKAVVSYTNLYQHMDDFSRGVVDTRPLVFYLTASALFLFLTTRTLDAKAGR